MVRRNINQTSFEKGQYATEFAGKYDSDEYQGGAELLRNVIVSPEGSVRRSPGTKEIYDDLPYTRTITFDVSVEATAVLNFQPDGDLKIYDPDSGTTTIATGMTAAQIQNFDSEKVRDTLFIVERGVAPKRLDRDAAGAWTLSDYVSKDGPWEELNLDAKLKISPQPGFATTDDNGIYGTGVIRAVNKAGNNSTWFLDEWVTQGRSIRLRQQDIGNTEVTEANIQLDSVKISTFEFNVTVDEEYPLIRAGGAFEGKNWRLSAWYVDNYPERVAYHNGRLWFFRDEYRWSTVSGDLDTFSPTLPTIDDSDWVVTDECGITVRGNESESSDIQWAVSHRVLHLGTDRGSSVLKGSSFFGAVTPSNVNVITQHQTGVSDISPVIGSFLYFVDISRTKIYKLEYEFINQSFTPSYVNGNNREIFISEGRIRDFMIISYPFKMMWVLLDNGNIAVGTSDAKEEMWAWSILDYVPTARSINKIKYTVAGAVRERPIVTDSTGSVYEFSDFEYRAGEVDSEVVPNGTPPFYNIGFVYPPVEYLMHNVTEYSGGVPIDLNSIGAGQFVINKTTYKVWKYSATSATVTPDNDYEVGTPFYVHIKTKLLDLVQNQFSVLKDTKKGLFAFFNLKKTGQFLFRDVGSDEYQEVEYRRVSDDPTEPPPLFTGIKEENWSTNETKFLQMEITQDMPVPFQLNSIGYDLKINELR